MGEWWHMFTELLFSRLMDVLLIYSFMIQFDCFSSLRDRKDSSVTWESKDCRSEWHQKLQLRNSKHCSYMLGMTIFMQPNRDAELTIWIIARNQILRPTHVLCPYMLQRCYTLTQLSSFKQY